MSTLEIAPFLMVRVWQFNSWHNSLLFEVSGILMEKASKATWKRVDTHF